MNNISKYAPTLSMVLIIIGLLLFLFSAVPLIGIYTFAAGAVILGLIRVLALVRSRNSKTISRIPQIHLLSVVALLGAAYMMYDGSNSWSVLLLVSAVLELYLSFRQK